VGRVAVGWEDRIEGLDDRAGFGDEGEALAEGHALDLEGGQPQRPGETQIAVAEQGEGNVAPGMLSHPTGEGWPGVPVRG